MGSFIISGQTEEARLARAQEIIGKNSSGVDLIVVSDSTGIEAVREIIRALSRKPYQSKQVSVLVPEADRLSPEAQNALLKTLEEPPGESNLILLSQNPASLLPTVRSRCLQIDLGPGGSQVSERELKSAWQAYQRGSLGELYDSSAEAKPAVWAELGRQIMLYQLGGEKLSKDLSRGLSLTEIAPKEELLSVAQKTDLASWQKFLGSAQEVENDLKANVNHKLALENLFLDLPRES